MEKISDLWKIFDLYLQNEDIARNNANFIPSLPTLEHIINGEVSKQLLFEFIVKDKEIKQLHEEGWVYCHQLFKISPYCIGLSARDLTMFGLQSNAPNERKAKPPKRLDTLFMQAANLICLIAQEVSGATSLNDLSTIAASYLYIEEQKYGRKYSHYQLVNLWQSFLYNINLPFRSGNSPFSNITLDFGKPAWHLENEYVTYAGQIMDFKYSEIPSDFYDRINKAFIDAMFEGDADGKPFTFPLITVNIDENFDWNNSAWKELLKKSNYFGGFYIQNYNSEPFLKTKLKEKNPYIKPFDKGMIYSNCCRMTFNIKDVVELTGSNPFHSNSGVGGIGVYAINLNRLLYLAGRDWNTLKELLDYLMEKGRIFLQRKREFIRKHYKQLYPYLSFYQKNDKTLFNIFSIIGGHEGMINAGFEEGLKDKNAQEYAIKIATYILGKLQKWSKEDGVPYSLEYAPSENAAVKCAKSDVEFAQKFSSDTDIKDLTRIKFLQEKLRVLKSKKSYKRNIFVQGEPGTNRVFLTSGFQLPFSEDYIDQIYNASLFQAFATGGAILHIFPEQDLSPEQQERLIRQIIENYPIYYFTKTPILTTCNDCGERIVGKRTECPTCKSKNVMVWSRPIGYFRPVLSGNISPDFRNAKYKFWLDGRIEDFATRKGLNEKDIEEIEEITNDLSSLI